MTLPAAELRRILTPLERNVIIVAGRERTRDPEKIRAALARSGVTVPVQRRTAVGSRTLTAEDVAALLASGCSALERAARARAYREEHPEPEPPRTLRVTRREPPAENGKPVTPSVTVRPDVTPESPERSDGMEAATPRPPSEDGWDTMLADGEGFVARINAEAQAEVSRVLRDLSKLRFEAHQVEHVLKALKLPVPPELETFLAFTGIPSLATPEPAPEATPEPPPAPAQAAAEETPAEDPEPPTEPEDAPAPAAAAPASRTDRQNAVLLALRANPGGLSTGETAKAIGGKPTATREALGVLLDQGLAEVRGTGPGTRWHATGATEPLPLPAPAAGDSQFPEHLRAMPSAQGRFSKTQLAAAEKEMAVLQAVNEAASAGNGTVVISEVMPRLVMDVPQARVGGALRDLEAAGLIRATGRYRFDEATAALPGMKGRAPKEYAALDRAPAAEAPETEEELEVTPEELASVRDFVCAVKDSFSVPQVIEVTKLDEAVVRKALSALIQREVVVYVGMDDLELYEYNPPTGPGRAAELDAKRVRESDGVVNGNGSGPIVGTGQGVGATDKDVKALITSVERAGGEVTKTGSNHYRITNPANGRSVIVFGTPGAPSRDKNRKRIQAIGLAV